METSLDRDLQPNPPDRPVGRSAVSPPPNYRITFEPSDKRVKVAFNGTVVADSTRAMIMRETRHAPVYYLPQEDIRMELLERSDHHTYCPFKGTASYWTIRVDGKVAENAVWGYEEPFVEAAEIKGYLAFYWNKVEAWYEADAEVSIDTSHAAQERPNRFADWLLREAWEAVTTEELAGRFARHLTERGVPLWRLAIITRSLHPQLLGNSYTWQNDHQSIEIRDIPHSSLESDAYLNSPLVPIFQGAGGIRRRLEGAEPRLDFPILEDFYAEGATDYVAMPLLFSDGQINAVTLASKQPGGFSTEDLGQVYEILPVFSRLLEVQVMRHTAKTLLDTYLGAYSGERVLNGLIKRGDGEVVPAVIWLADLRGSTALADTIGRDAYLDLINDFFDCTAGAVLEQGGEVLKFIGDGVLAIFPIEGALPGACGSPEKMAKKGLRKACTKALKASRDSLARLEQLNRARLDQGESPLRFALAVNLGDVTYGNVGVPGRLDFTVIGPAANETARLEDICKRSDQTVVFSEAFARVAEAELASLGRHQLRGVETDQEIFTLPELIPLATAP